MKYSCSIHMTEECNEILNNFTTKWGFKKTRMLEFLIKNGVSEFEKNPLEIGKLFADSCKEMQTKQPTTKEFIDTLFTRASFEGRNFVWQRDIYKSLKPKHAADPIEIEKLGYIKYIPEGQYELAWMKN